MTLSRTVGHGGPQPGTVLELSRWFEAPIDLVFEAFTDPDLLRQWWGPRDFVIEELEFEAAVGGSYRVVQRSPGGSRYEHRGVVTEMEQPSRLAYSWRWTDGPLQRQEMLVELDFETEGEGTRVKLRQSRFIDKASRDAHAGWPQSFERLAAWIAARS